MKRILIVAVLLVGLVSCRNSYKDTADLQEIYSTVYKVSDDNYIVIDSANTVYHLKVIDVYGKTVKIRIK